MQIAIYFLYSLKEFPINKLMRLIKKKGNYVIYFIIMHTNSVFNNFMNIVFETTIV